MSTETTPTEITFSEAYDQLKSITNTLNNEEVEADELVDLLRRGKGLEVVLREHLSNIEQEVTAIESGEGILPYKIVAATTAQVDADAEAVADTSDFVASPATETAGGDDDIPF